MASEFPRSPRVMRGGLVAYQVPELLPTIIVFQYNPNEVQRAIRLSGGSGGGRGDAGRVSGPPSETISFTVDIDAADQLERPSENPITVASGLHPVIAALEGLLYPAYSHVIANEALALAGSAFIAGEQAPMVFLVWGPSRVVPVLIDSVNMREQAFDQQLNPIRVQAEISASIQTYRDLDVTNPGYWVYLASFQKKEAMAALNTLGERTGIRGILPI